MRALVLTLPVFAALITRAEVKTVTGYGTGDTLDQALIMAQSDAVLNAGGRVSTVEQIKGDVLVSDRGVSSNMLFVSEYKILEKGESFDGVSARIEAKVCNVSERQFENGKYVFGEGEGSTAKMAHLAAIGNALSSLGIRVKAVGEYDKDDLVRDETETVAWAFVSDIEEVESTCENGKCKSKVKIKVFASKADSGIDKTFSRETAGSGMSFFEAMNNARSKAVFGLASAYVMKSTYESGELVSRSIRHDWRGFCYGTEIIDKKQDGNAWDVNVRLNFDENENSHRADGVFSASGFGLANNREDAVEDAKRDAVVNAGSVADIVVVYEEGKEFVEQSKFKGVAYIGLQAADVKPAGEKVLAQIDAKVSRDRERDSECMLARSVASDNDRDAYRAYLLARFKSFVAAGALYDVERAYSGNAILTDTCSITSARANCGFTVYGLSVVDNGNESRSVQVQTHGLTEGAVADDTVIGVGLGRTETVAFELARNDAVVNACSEVAVKGRSDGNELKEFRQLFVGTAFVGDVTVSAAVDVPQGRMMCVKARVSGTSKDVEAVRPPSVDYEAKADSADSAIALARRGLLMKSGAMAKVRMKYKGAELMSSDAEYSAHGVLSGCKMEISGDSQNAYTVHASGRIAGSCPGHGKTKVEGFGWGTSFQAARREAIAYAVLNYKGDISGEEKYAMGVLDYGRSRCDANGFLFKVELAQCVQNDDGCFVKVLCSFADEEGKLSGGKKEVKAIGWGSDEESAKADAERNAIDSVFGRKVTAAMAEENGRVTFKQDTELSFEEGYVEDTIIKESKVENGLHLVKIKTVVRQRGLEESGFSLGWLGWIVLFFLLSGIIFAAKEKGGKALATIALLIIAMAFFVTGHWVMGIVMGVVGLGIIRNDN